MARPLIAALAPGMVLQPGYVVKLLALDPTTGNAVANVTVKSVSMQVDVADPEDTSTAPIVAPFYSYS